MIEMLKVVVERSRWLRGRAMAFSKPGQPMSNQSFLLRESDGMMCCMGFACIASGLEKREILNVRTPLKLVCPPAWSKDEETLDRLFLINDDQPDDYTDPQREAIIITLGEKIGLAFEFVDRPVPDKVCILEVDSPSYPPQPEEYLQCGCDQCMKDYASQDVWPELWWDGGNWTA